jgi:hypothetical protein
MAVFLSAIKDRRHAEERPKGASRSTRERGHAVLPVLVTVALCFLMMACSQSNNTSDRDRQGGFYGGVSGGLTR